MIGIRPKNAKLLIKTWLYRTRISKKLKDLKKRATLALWTWVRNKRWIEFCGWKDFGITQLMKLANTPCTPNKSDLCAKNSKMMPSFWIDWELSIRSTLNWVNILNWSFWNSQIPIWEIISWTKKKINL